MILFRGKYPRWWFDWNLELYRFTARISAYLFLLRDDYPSTDERQAVTVDIEYPDVQNDLSRVLPLFKWFLAIPHYIVLGGLGFAGAVVTVLSWFVILITGEQPQVDVRVSGSAHALVHPGLGLRVPADHGSLSAVPAGRVACVPWPPSWWRQP